jgi:NAD-specific glutamate dehydrogenase
MGRPSPSLHADDLAAEHLALTSTVLQTPTGSNASATDPVASWITTHTPAITRRLALVTETAQTTTNPLASLSVVLRQLRKQDRVIIVQCCAARPTGK